MKSKFVIILIFIASSLMSSGCGTVAGLVGINQKCVVISKRAQVRSSGAVVAADLLEVKRGQTLEVLDEMTFENEKWYNVRASDEEATEGWIESRHVITQKLLEESQRIAEQDKDVPAQASGLLRAASNLRLSPDRNSTDNIMFKLTGGDTFDIVGYKRVPKVDDRNDDKDDTPKNGGNVNAQANSGAPRARQKNENEPVQLDDKYDTWYKVRLDPSVSPAPAGWVYGKQVELTVPSDIIFYRTGREFVAWKKLDDDAPESTSSFMNRRENGREAKPGSWVILEKSNILREPEGEEPDFDRILIIGYDKYDQTHYKVYRSGNVKGFLPLRVTGSGDSRAFSVRMKGNDGEIREMQFGTYKDARGHLKVNIPTDIPKDDKSDV
jgi:hypothetical protein